MSVYVWKLNLYLYKQPPYKKSLLEDSGSGMHYIY